MSRTVFLASVFAVLAASLLLTASCGSSSTAYAAEAAHAPESSRHELVILRADGSETHMEIIGFTHEIVSPRDAASGLPTGKRQHKPLNITKPIDKATPLIANSLIKLDVFQSATLRSYRTQNGREELFRTIVLMSPWVNARATEDDTHGEVVRHETREHVAFCYQKITWTWHDGGVTAEDDWEAPRG